MRVLRTATPHAAASTPTRATRCCILAFGITNCAFCPAPQAAWAALGSTQLLVFEQALNKGQIKQSKLAYGSFRLPGQEGGAAGGEAGANGARRKRRRDQMSEEEVNLRAVVVA